MAFPLGIKSINVSGIFLVFYRGDERYIKNCPLWTGALSMKKLLLLLFTTAVVLAVATPAFAKTHKKHHRHHHHTHTTTQPTH